MTLILLPVAWLLTYLLHSTVLLGGAWILERLRLVSAPIARDTLWKVALLGGLVTATAQLALRVRPATGHVAIAAVSDSPFIQVAGEFAAPAVAAGSLVTGDAPARLGESTLSDAPPAAPAVPWRFPLARGIHISWPALLLDFWLLGALALSARLVAVRSRLRGRLRHRRPVEGGPLVAQLQQLAAEAGVRRPVRITVCPGLCGPIAFGTAEICLPERVSRLDAAGQRAVLAHELGHVVRRDPAWLMAAAVVESVLFFQPLNRLARRRLQEVAEYLCDDWAADRSDGIALARCLAEVASWMNATPQLAPVSGMAENRSHLVARVQRLLDGARGPGGGGAHTVVRLAAGALALGAVLWAAPGVAAEDVGEEATAVEVAKDDGGEAWKASFASADDGDGWASVRDGGHLIVLHAGYSARLVGQGRLGFRQWGRAIAVPDGYTVMVGGEEITADRTLCQEETLRIVDGDGRTAWTVEPVVLSGAPAYSADRSSMDRVVADAIGRVRVRRDMRGMHVDVPAGAEADTGFDSNTDLADAVDEALVETKVDGAIDTLLRAWARDPDAVRAAARRIAHTYDRELRPQFESLGVEVGRQLTPELERLTTRLGRDLAPEFARLGAELGRTIVAALEDGGLPVDDGGAGAGDFRTKRRPKRN